jgi:hypothetical protein
MRFSAPMPEARFFWKWHQHEQTMKDAHQCEGPETWLILPV